MTAPALAGEAFDFVDAVAKEVPIRVLARIMGLPGADLDSFIDLGDKLIANTDPEITDVVWGRDDTDAYRRFPFRSPYGKQLWDLGRAVVADRLRDPGDDLLSRLLRAEVDGDRLSEVDLDNFFSILVIAGNETTRIAIAQGILAFCAYPAQWPRLRAEPGLLEFWIRAAEVIAIENRVRPHPPGQQAPAQRAIAERRDLIFLAIGKNLHLDVALE